MTTYYLLNSYGLRTGEQFEAPSHKAAYSELSSRLSVSGPRRLWCETDSGAEIASSLSEGHDESYIRPAPRRART